MNSPLILSYNDYSRANAEKKEKVKYGGSNLKVYIFLADGFEEIEGLTVVDIMRRAKIDVETISITDRNRLTGHTKSLWKRIGCLRRRIFRMGICSYFRAECRER